MDLIDAAAGFRLITLPCNHQLSASNYQWPGPTSIVLALIPPGTGETGLASQLAGSAAANGMRLFAIHGAARRRTGGRTFDGMGGGGGGGYVEQADSRGWMGEESRPGAERRGWD